jgi:hypothetical protein
MGKYASWAELERNVPISYKEGAYRRGFRGGMQGIAPSGDEGEGRARDQLPRRCRGQS